MSDNAENADATAEQEQTAPAEDTNMLSMSDEDIANMTEPGDAPVAEAASEDQSDEEQPGSDDSEGTDDSESTTQDDDEEAADSDSDTSDDSGDGTSDDQSAEGDDDDAEAPESSEDSDTTDDTDDSKDEPAIAAKAVADIQKLLSPFKANGKQIQVENVDDAITLMQMGANFNKKMAVLKPNLKYVKMLENAGLLDAGKLSNLIDLSKKNPAAIKQLIKDSGINPLDIDVQKDTGYEAGTYNVSDNEVDLDLVLADLKETPKFNETMDIISNKLDEASKRILVDSPAIIRVINEHVELGIYDKIAAVVERERMLGRLTHLNDLEAYKLVSDGINAKGGFDAPESTSTEKTDESDAEATKQKDKKTKARKKSAAPTKSAPGKSEDTDFNPLAMSDDDIENMPSSKYM